MTSATQTSTDQCPVALITGAARRIGAQIAHTLHQRGYRVILHYRQSASEAEALCQQLNQQRPDSAVTLGADLNQLADIQDLSERSLQQWGRLDLLVNNASSFYPTPLGSGTEAQWDDLIGSNMKAPFFLAQALAVALKQQRGSIINIVDIHADHPLKEYPIYCMAKAGNAMLVKSLARELAPEVRVNGIAPGAILWPNEDQQQGLEFSQEGQQQLLDKVPLERIGEPADIARTLVFLADEAPYITGQIVAVDGGRTLSI